MSDDAFRVDGSLFMDQAITSRMEARSPSSAYTNVSGDRAVSDRPEAHRTLKG